MGCEGWELGRVAGKAGEEAGTARTEASSGGRHGLRFVSCLVAVNLLYVMSVYSRNDRSITASRVTAKINPRSCGSSLPCILRGWPVFPVTESCPTRGGRCGAFFRPPGHGEPELHRLPPANHGRPGPGKDGRSCPGRDGCRGRRGDRLPVEAEGTSCTRGM